MSGRRLPLVLVAGGLHDCLGPEDFWEAPGVAPSLRRLGWAVHTPRRAAEPSSWDDEAAVLAGAVTDATAGVGGPVALIAASNGCSVALRLAADRPDLVAQLVLCWPATGDDPTVDRRERDRLTASGMSAVAVGRLLDGELVRGLRPDELRAVAAPVTLVPAEPEDEYHQLRTVAALRRTLPHAVLGLGTVPSPHASFAAHLGAFVSLLDVVLVG